MPATRRGCITSGCRTRWASSPASARTRWRCCAPAATPWPMPAGPWAACSRYCTGTAISTASPIRAGRMRPAWGLPWCAASRPARPACIDMSKLNRLRNIAIIAHVDHGKTTLVDRLLQQSGTLDARADLGERIMDSNDLERERGITILSKNTAIRWGEWRVNIVDTPGHADFGGEVERVLSMVDSVLLLVDAVDGPMPQTRFVTQKAFAMGFKPIVVINKVDRPGARPDWVLNQTFDLFDKLGATDDQLDFPVIYASGLNGYAGLDDTVRSGDLTPLFEALIEHVPAPPVDPDGPFQMQVSTLSYSTYVGLIGVGRIRRGRVKTNQPVVVIDREGKERSGRVLQVLGFKGLKREEIPEAEAGDIVGISGLERISISDTICDS